MADVNRYLKWAFVEAANAICLNRGRPPRRHVSRLYERVTRRKGHQKAIGAVARHLAEATYWILAKQEAYREPKAATVSSTGIRADDHELPEARPLITISPEITIMPPMTAKIWLRRNGSMRPETTAFSPQTHACPTARIGSGPRMVHGTSAAHASSSRDSPDIARTSGKAQRFQIWVMSSTRRRKAAAGP